MSSDIRAVIIIAAYVLLASHGSGSKGTTTALGGKVNGTTSMTVPPYITTYNALASKNFTNITGVNVKILYTGPAVVNGAVAGVNAILLINAQQYGIKASNVLVEVDPAITDPKYAELAIEGLQKLISLDIDLEELDKEAKMVEAKIRDMLKNVKDTHEQYNNTAESTSGPSMYA